MNEGGERARQEAQKEAARQLLAEFHGDTEAALEAVREQARFAGLSASKVPGQQRQCTSPQVQSPQTPVLLSVRQVTRSYKLAKETLTVLDAVDFAIHEKEIIAITGASGSGKSTLLNLLGGLDKPTSGEVLVGEVSLAKLSDAKLSAFRQRTIGFVFQFFYLQPFLTLKRNLEVPGMFARVKRKERSARVIELARTVGLEDRLKHYPKELSGGQMQRAAIARALLNNPRIILADEPTGNLDSQNGKQIIELFESIRDELGTTIVIVTHDPAIAARADRVIHLADGKVVA